MAFVVGREGADLPEKREESPDAQILEMLSPF